MNTFSREGRRSSLLINTSKDILNFKIFPLPSSRHNLQKRIETYSSFSRQQISKIQNELIEIKKFKQLVCNSLQLQYLYHPIISILQQQYEWAGQKIKINQIFQILIQGKFFRKLPKQGYIFLTNNNTNTQTNISCIIAAILVYVSGKLNLTQIQRILKVFQYQEKLSETSSSGISIQYQKILKIFKKLQRKVKPLQFKQWIQQYKKVTNKQKIENFHFLYLSSLSEARMDKNSYAFMDLNLNKDKKNKYQDKKNQSGQNGIQLEIKDLNQNQKYRIRSLSFQENRRNLPAVIAFKDIKSHLNETQSKLKEKKKSMSLLSRIKTKYETAQDEGIFRQLKFTENRIQRYLPLVNNEKSNISQRSIRAFSTQGNNISRKPTGQQSRKLSKNKQNQVFPQHICKDLLKEKLVLNLPNNKTKKISLNREQHKISLKFANVLNYHEKKIQNQQRKIRTQQHD